jgi:flavorubredoxin
MSKPHVVDITPDVKWIGALDYDIVSFDVVMETKHGTTYNSYFIDAEKKTIIDTVKERFFEDYLAKIKAVVNPEEIEYIIVNHTEPDHSGNLRNLLNIAPNATVLGSSNAIRYLKDIIGPNFPHKIVKNGETLDLGNKTMEFITAPNLHWPDTIYTYLKEDKLLFTCDSFGCHYCDDKIFDDAVPNFDEAFKYYYDVILKPYSKFMLQAIEKIEPLEINMICPGHGPILRSHWKKYVEVSKQYALEGVKIPEKKIVYIPYVSAYHKTGVLAEHIAEGARQAGDIETIIHDIENATLGELEEKLNMSAAIVVGSPVINQNILFPIYKLFAAINPLRDKGKLAGAFGSYGWSGENKKMIATNLSNLKLNMQDEGVFVKFTPTDEDLNKCREYGLRIGTSLLEN